MKSPIFRCCLGIATIAFSVIAIAQVYKWVDEHGITHYSSVPPPGTSVRKLDDVSAPAPETIEAARERSQKIIDEARRATVDRRRLNDLEAEREAAAQRSADADARSCGKARQQLAVLESNRPVYRLDEGGQRVYINDKIRDAEIDRARAEVDRACEAVDAGRSAEEAQRYNDWQQAAAFCASLRQRLGELERPEARTSKADIQRAREAVDQACSRGQ